MTEERGFIKVLHGGDGWKERMLFTAGQLPEHYRTLAEYGSLFILIKARPSRDPTQSGTDRRTLRSYQQ